MRWRSSIIAPCVIWVCGYLFTSHPHIKIEVPCSVRKCIIFHSLWATHAFDHGLLQSADYFLPSMLSYPMCSSPKVSHPPTWDIFALYVWPHYASFLSPTEGAFWAGPWGGCRTGKQAFFLVRGMLLMRWSNGSPHCAHRDTEDKSNSG